MLLLRFKFVCAFNLPKLVKCIFCYINEFPAGICICTDFVSIQFPAYTQKKKRRKMRKNKIKRSVQFIYFLIYF